VRDDLLDAEVCIDWADAQIPILGARIEAWKEKPPFEIVTEFDPQRRKNALKIDVQHRLPRIISGEVGAIIHRIRSSLDLLAVSLAKRNGHPCPKQVYFPISASDKAFFDHGGLEKIKRRLSSEGADTVKGLKPYRGGNESLYALHYFDIERKYRQLLRIRGGTEQWGLTGIGIDAEFPESPPFDVEHGAILAWIAIECARLTNSLSAARTCVGVKIWGCPSAISQGNNTSCRAASHRYPHCRRRNYLSNKATIGMAVG
jgi:hypothetical protein